jgi:hypothetical protein
MRDDRQWHLVLVVTMSFFSLLYFTTMAEHMEMEVDPWFVFQNIDTHDWFPMICFSEHWHPWSVSHGYANNFLDASLWAKSLPLIHVNRVVWMFYWIGPWIHLIRKERTSIISSSQLLLKMGRDELAIFYWFLIANAESLNFLFCS